VEQVTWFDAILYANVRSKRDGYDTVYTYTGVTGTGGSGCQNLAGLASDFSKNGYRLPTEAEWEYACRAGSNAAYSFGDSLSDLGTYAWYSGNAGSQTHAVAQKLPNAFGLYDMQGNVFEYCHDWYGGTYYQISGNQDPTGPAGGTQRVARGGAWGYADDFSPIFRTRY
jgi:formylglycine-generating enzyme required for sulfatase activity